MVEEAKRVVRLEQASAEPYSSILSYPHPDDPAVASRIRQLRQLGVLELEFNGHLRHGQLSLLGKGVAGIVLVGHTSTDKIALKIRRTDSRRDSMRHETFMLQAANDLEVGPRYLASTTDVLAMELLEGPTLPQWLLTLKGRGRRTTLRRIVRDLLGQCFRLDNAGLDHGELSRAHKNIIVTERGRPCILDFESASKYRRPNNLTALTQYFFLGGVFSRKVRRILGPTDSEKLKRILRSYKSNRTPEAFQRVLTFLKLQA